MAGLGRAVGLRPRGRHAPGRRRRSTRRRDDLARTLTLDQGKPLEAEARDEVEELIAYFDMAAADATRHGGPDPAVGRRRQARPALPRASRRGRRDQPWNWPYTMPAEIVAPALAAGNAVVLAPAPDDQHLRRQARRVPRRGRPAVRRLQPGDRARPGGRGRARRQPGDGRGRVHRLDRHRPYGRARAAPARSCSWRWAATARW